MSASSSDVVPGGRWVSRGLAACSAGAERLRRLPVPWVIGSFVAVEWIAVAALALTVRHNGWVFYQGGDQLWYYTLGWLLGNGQLTQTIVGYGWSVALTPLSWIFGPSLLAALPAIVLFNVLVLLPTTMLALYGLASRIGGRLFGYWTLLLWLVVPFVGIRYTNLGYHQRYTELTLPQSFGLTALSDFPTMVATIVSLYFCARVATGPNSRRLLLLDGAAAGAVAGIVVAFKPSTSLFLVGPALMFLWTRRFASLGAFAAAMSPALLALAVWKARGLGNVPLFSNGLGHHGSDLAAGVPLVGLAFSKYFSNLSWSHLTQNVDQLREHFWSGRLLVWLVFAGLIGLARRSRWAVLLVGGALLPLTFVKAAYPYAQVQDGSIFRLLMPCFPMFVILLASTPLLLPGVPRRLAGWQPPIRQLPHRGRAALVVATVVVSGIIPLAAFAAADTGSGGATAAAITNSSFTQVPVPGDVGSIDLTASVVRGHILLRWRPQRPRGSRAFYRLSRGSGPTSGLSCQSSPGARWCVMGLPEIRVTRATSYVDRPDPGRWTYRVAVASNWLDDPGYGDVYYFSRSVTVDVPPRP
ncbi:MAG TPA: hypothetical protein VFI01_12415 [Gaiellaceae bacterium]|nr:hypothetical protein [Gaiellaceae bacterium]